MADYDVFGRFYDAIMGDRAEARKRLRAFIRQASPMARNVLELGCGTGSVLKHLARDYEVWGLDLSKTMLSIAKKKLPEVKLFRRDMVRFQLPEAFDVICCVYDSINHVLSFADWQKLFANVHHHLSDKGVFIFDINTQRKLRRHIGEPAWIHPFGKNLLIMDVTAKPRNISNRNIKVFECTKANRYLLHEENIREASFPIPNIVSALDVHFRRIEIIDADRRRPSARSERLDFICRK